MLTEPSSPPYTFRKKIRRSEYLNGHFPPDFFGPDRSIIYTRAKKKHRIF